MDRYETARPGQGRGGAPPVVAPTITSLTGSTPDGMPLALNRTPREALQPWVRRIGVTDVALPPGKTIDCGTLNEHAVLRIIFGARWTATTADGDRDYEPGDAGMPLFFGPNSRLMRLVVYGSFRVVTINLVPGAAERLSQLRQAETIDRIYHEDPLTGSQVVSPGYCPRTDKRRWLDAAEDQLAANFQVAAPKAPERLMAAFETLCLTDPGASLDAFAAAFGMTRRTIERSIVRGWGVSPREALRRARALDMAAALLGVALEDEAQELRLRYFDQSHLIREMRHYFGMTPGQLLNEPHPLLRITMEIRQSRRIEAIARIGAEEPRPWRDPDAEPASRGP